MAALSTSSPFRDPGIQHGERSTYAAKLGDKPFTSGIVSVIDAANDRSVSTIDARIGKQFAMKIEQTFLRDGGHLHTDRYKTESRFEDQLVTREEGFFSETKHLQFGGHVAGFPSGLMPLVGGLTLLRGLPFDRGAKATVLPPFVMHFEAAAPHRMLSFSFPTGPMPRNPRAVIELTA